LIFITLYACEKEEVNATTKVSTETQLSNYDRIMAFKKMLNSEKKGDLSLRTTYTGEELIWEIEADINYTYGNPHLQYDAFDISETTIEVSELSGTINSRVLARVYEEVLDFVECHYEDVGFTNKYLQFVDVYLVTGEDSIGVYSVVGDLTTTSSSLWFTPKSFGVGDNWDGFSSNCANTAGITRSAATEIGRYTNWNLGPHAVQLGYYLTDIAIHEVFPAGYPGYNNYNPNDPTEEDWLIDFMIWWLDYCDDIYDSCTGLELESGTTEFDDAMCIEYDEMNFYLDNVEDYIEDLESSLSKVFVQTRMRSEASLTFEYRFFWDEETWFGVENFDKSGLTDELEDCP
jgi:hypothetical protein